MLAIIDYGSGNLRSVAKAFERVAAGGQEVRVVRPAEALTEASHIVLPGVGAFADCMAGLSAIPGMTDALEEQAIGQKKWFLGICVGMQMLFTRGHEHGMHKGLGWLKGEVVALVPSPVGGGLGRGLSGKDSLRSAPLPASPLWGEEILKIPHMGWNELAIEKKHPLPEGVESGAHAYFVPRYHAMCGDHTDLLATAAYGQTIAAVVGRDNIMGTQFHPEKSQETGLALLKNFWSL